MACGFLRSEGGATLPDVVESLILDFLEWVGPCGRPYGEVLEAWRTSCPRLPVWEEAFERRLVERSVGLATGRAVTVTDAGREHLERHRRSHDLSAANVW